MKLSGDWPEIFVPDGVDPKDALARSTHMAVAAHQDDLEIMAYPGILACFHREDLWFCGVVVTDGSGSPREDLYREFSDQAMRAIRRSEQKKAAVVGEYGAQVLLDYPSETVKHCTDPAPTDAIERLLEAARPGVLYTHNLADKHDTHVAVALRVIQAARRLPAASRPQRLYGCEILRDLDWMLDTDKVAFDCSAHENLQAALLGVFDSQISGGKRYDLATLGRRRANATYHAANMVDVATGMAFAMDLTPLLTHPTLDLEEYVQQFVDRFSRDVRDRIRRLSLPPGETSLHPGASGKA